jgi:anaerobic nitric oxide reductase flavorubredoxin
MAGLLDELKGLKLTGKKAAAFGSFGWANMNTNVLTELLIKCGFELPETKSISVNWNPDADKLEECRKFGAEFAKWCKV